MVGTGLARYGEGKRCQWNGMMIETIVHVLTGSYAVEAFTRLEVCFMHLWPGDVQKEDC